MSSHIDVFFVYISSHAKVSDLAHFIITHQYVPSSQITMDDLNSKQKRLDISSVSINLLVVQNFHLDSLHRHFEKAAPSARCYATHYLSQNRT